MSKKVIKRFYRNTDDQILFGVCSGVADYFEIDPTIVRLLYVLMSCFCPPMIIVYFVAGVIMPTKPKYKEAKIIEEKEDKK